MFSFDPCSGARAVRVRARRVRGFPRGEEHGDAPKPRRADNGIQHAGDHRRLPAEQEGNQIKLKQADKPPS